MFLFCSRVLRPFPHGSIHSKRLALTIAAALFFMQFGAAWAQSDWSGWHHCDIPDHDYDGPGTRYFCRPVSWDWICNVARITSLCNNPSGRNSERKSEDSGDGASVKRVSSEPASIAYSSVSVQRIDAAGIGVPWIIDAGFIDAIDVWGDDVQGEFCLDGAGSLLFLDAGSSPRAQSWLDSFQRASQTCAEIDRAGTIVLMKPPAPAGETAQQSRQCRPTTSGSLRVRARPSLEADTIGFVRRGTTLRTLSRSGNWIEIEYQRETGWVSAGFVSEDCGESGDPAQAATQGGAGVVCALGNLRVRARASLEADTIGFVRRGITLRTLSRRGNWIEIEYQADTGWVSADFVSEDCGESGDPAQAARRGRAGVVCALGNLRVRARPSLEADTIGFVRRGVTLDAVSRLGNWIEVEYQGEAGWVGAGYASDDCG